MSDDARTSPESRRRAWLAGSAAVVALFAQQSLDQRNGWWGIVLYAIAALLFAAAIKRTERTDPTASAAPLTAWPAEARQALAAATVLVLLVLIVVDTEAISGVAWILQAGSIALALAAARFADQGRQPPAPLPRSPIDLTTATTQVILGAVIVVGAWVRFRGLGDIPRGFWVDEADVGLVARRITDEGYRPVFADPVPAYHAYLVAVVSTIFGEGVTSVRAVSAITGTATIGAGYFAGRELFGKMAGLILAFIVAFSRWNVTLSRVGMNNVMLPLFALLTLGFLLRGRRRQSHLDYALAGLSAGAAMLFYSAIASSLIALGVFALYLAWIAKQRPASFGSQLFVGAIAAIAITTPLLKFIVTDSDRYLARNRTTALWSPAGRQDHPAVWDGFKASLRRYLPMTHYDGDGNGRHNIPAEPMLPAVIGGLSIMGLGAAVVRADRWLTVLALAWLPLAFAPGVLSLPWEAPNSLRAVAVQPLAFVLAVAAVILAAHTLVSSRQLKYVTLGVVAIALSFTGWSDVRAYFDANQNRDDVWAVHSTAETIAAGLTAEADASTSVQAASFFRNGKVHRFLAPDRDIDRYFGTDMQLPLYVPEGQDALLFATVESFDIAAQAPVVYPNSQVQRLFDGQQSELVVVQVPASDLAASLGWSRSDDELHHAALLVTEPDRYRFRLAPTDSETTSEITVDGFTLHTCEQEPELALAAGIHLVTVRTSDEQPQLQWSRAQDPGWSGVPTDRLIKDDLVPGGLRASHVHDADDVALYEIDTTINLRMHEFVLPRPYQSQWTGGLTVPSTADYEFFVRSDDPVRVTIDGQIVIETGDQFADVSAVAALPEATLPISVVFDDVNGRSQISLRWRVVGSTDEPMPIPSEMLVPWLETEPAPCTG